MVATISIAGDADIALYDVAVTNPDRKKGISTESFEVTTAVAIGTFCTASFPSVGRAINDAGQVVGRSCGDAFFWEPGAAMVNLGPGVATGIDQAGLTAVGNSPSEGAPYIWTRAGVGAAWLRSHPPTGGWAGRAYALASDASGNAAIIGGVIREPVSKRATVDRAVLWLRSGSGWQLMQLPLPAGVSPSTGIGVNDVNAAGQAVGSRASVLDQAVVWDPQVGGGYTAALLPGNGFAQGISPDGNIVVGLSEDRAAYWRRENGVWSNPVHLAPVCSGRMQTWANKVNAEWIVVGKSCAGGHAWQIGADGTVVVVRLPGFGGKSSPDSRDAWAVNNASPARAAGMTENKVAAYWELPF